MTETKHKETVVVFPEMDLLDVLSDDDFSKLFELCVVYRYGEESREIAWLIKEEWKRLTEKYLATDYAVQCKTSRIIPFPVRQGSEYRTTVLGETKATKPKQSRKGNAPPPMTGENKAPEGIEEWEMYGGGRLA